MKKCKRRGWILPQTWAGAVPTCPDLPLVGRDAGNRCRIGIVPTVPTVPTFFGPMRARERAALRVAPIGKRSLVWSDCPLPF
jgi:hypothetical protein